MAVFYFNDEAIEHPQAFHTREYISLFVPKLDLAHPKANLV